MESLIEISDVKKSFGEKKVFDGLTLAIHQGEVLTIMGGSGSGKSVLLKIILGLMDPDYGNILFEGLNVHHLSETELRKMRKRIGMLFQGAALFDSLTVYENVAYPLREHFEYPEDKVADTVAEKLELVGLGGVEELMPAELSGGMKKRVALARAIATDPHLILYDEPTTGLDPSNTQRINRLILALQKQLKVTSIVVTHDMASAFQVSNRIALLVEGKIEFVGTTEEMQTKGSHLVQGFIQGTLSEGELT